MNYANASKFAIQKENRVYVFEFIPPVSYEEIDAVLQQFRDDFANLKQSQLEAQAQQEAGAEKQPEVTQ